MKNFKEDKVIIALVVIFLVGTIGFNLENYTGNLLKLQEDKNVPIVSISPSVVTAGEYIEIKVKVRDACVHRTIDFFFDGTEYDGTKKNKGGRKATAIKPGRYKFCKRDYGLVDSSFTLRYKTSPSWDGDYYARVYYWKDRTTKDYVHSYFKVKPN